MKLAITLRVSPGEGGIDMGLVWEAERLGYEAAWVGEAYGTDAVTPVAWVLARTSRIKAGTGIMQMPARTPACAAMTAMTLQALSGNRFLCGVGPSGPQVVEGWHGVPFGKPLARTTEYIAIIRQIVAREAPLEHHGEHYDIPYTGPGGSGLAKPLRSIVHGDPSLKIYTAPNSPAGLRTAGEVADGALPYFMSPEKAEIMVGPIREGRARAGKPAALDDFDLAPFVRVAMGDDLVACRDKLRPGLALYIGGMGARSRNFYNDLAKRLGYQEAAETIQEHFLAGRREAAAAAVPDALIDEISLVGPPDRIRDRLQAWQALAADHRVGSIVLSGADAAAMRVVAEAML
ncbi:MAG TPA: LLM class F420-dependent oxidoreductase [Stellaceae bacterium]|nr:LLM class F420-dependent oxidoreductase [Stellaceae bacterium]